MSNLNYDLDEIENVAMEAVVASGIAPDESNARAVRIEFADGDIEYKVLITEMNPNAFAFRQMVADAIKKAGFEYVEVVTEW